MIFFNNHKKKYKILFVTSEAAPFAKVGGLGEVMFSLPRALKRLGHDARVMIPRYGTIDAGYHNLTMAYEGLDVPTGPNSARRLRCNVRRFDATESPHDPVTVYFLENQEYYELRSNVYGYIDDRIRFALLSRGCLEFLNLTREWIPDIIVCTDWMTGFLPSYLRTAYGDYKRLRHLAAVLSIHNLESYGTAVPIRFVPEMDRDAGRGSLPDFFSNEFKNIDGARRGIISADVINTVSPTYAKEIMTEKYGEGMDQLLRERRDVVFGILNGIDYETVNPETDPLLAKNFTVSSLADRIENKAALQKRFGLPQGIEKFIIGAVSRLTGQKGFSLLETALEPFLKSTGAQFVVVGTGDAAIMDFFMQLQRRFPEQVSAHLQFDDTLPHLVYSGADTVLIPSRFEPSGLIQMEAMRFGAVPVARRVGGLADTVVDDPSTDRQTGFLFDEFDPNAFLVALSRAYELWRHQDVWKTLQQRVMEEDFSWDRSAKEYEKLFEKALALRAKENSKE